MNCILAVYLAIAVLALLVFIYRNFVRSEKRMDGKNVVITGGSSGVGLGVAQRCLDRGASKLVLIARSQNGLDKAIASLKYSKEKQIVKGVSADVSDFESMKAAFDQIKEFMGSIDYLFANAGFAKPGLLQEMTSNDIDSQMKVNYIGAAYATKLAQPLLNENAHVTYSGSICSILSFTGYAGYGPSKYALRALAETLRNELRSSKVNIHLCIISTVDTPGLKRENESKPDVCAAIEGTASLFTPGQIAEKIFEGLDRNDYVITMEFLSWIMLELNCGIIPSNNIFLSLLVAPFLPIIRLGALIYIDVLARKPLPKVKQE